MYDLLFDSSPAAHYEFNFEFYIRVVISMVRLDKLPAMLDSDELNVLRRLQILLGSEHRSHGTLIPIWKLYNI